MGYLIEIDLSPPSRIFRSAKKLLPVLLHAKGKLRSPALDAAEKHKRKICKKNCLLKIRARPGPFAAKKPVASP